MSSSRSSPPRVPASPMLWYSSTVKRRVGRSDAMLRIRRRSPPPVNVPEPIHYTPQAMSFVSHVECTICGHRHDAKRVLSVCEQCGQMLAVRYDLEQVNKHATKEALRARPPGMYRFRELTPLDRKSTRLNSSHGSTPLLALRRLAAHFGL